MRHRIVMLAGITRTGRHQAMAAVNDAVVQSGGWVEGHTLLSNIATVFRLELSAQALEALLPRLVGLDIRLDDDSLAVAGQMIRSARDPGLERPVSLNLTFLHDEPDLRRPVPAVPG